jgi:hypothetical protein
MKKPSLFVTTLAFALLVAGCGDIVDGGLYDEYTLAGKLESLAPNTAQNPYTIALDVDMETAAAYRWVTINSTIADNEKFVFLDLSFCTAPATITSGFGDIIHENKYIKGIILPFPLTGIGRYAFAGCVYLTGVIIPNSVTSIGEGAFSGCTSLSSVTIPDSVLFIGDLAFSNTPLTSVTFEGSDTSFSYNSSTESFPYSVSLYWAYCDGGTGTYVLRNRSWMK